MPLFSRKDFALHCGIEMNALRTYIGRGKVVEGADRFIDSSHPTNKTFHLSLSVKKEKTIKPSKKNVPSPKGTPGKDSRKSEKEPDIKNLIKKAVDIDHEAAAYQASVRRVKQLDAQKRQVEVDLLQQKYDKLQGETVPSALIKPVIMQHNQFLVSDFKNAGDQIIREMAKLHDFTGAETAELRGKLIQVINEAVKKATSSTVKAIASIIEEHSEARGKGERL